MTRSSPRLSVVPSPDTSPKAAPLSRPYLSVRPSVRKVGNVLWLQPQDDAAFRHFFTGFFAGWLQANFDRPEHVAAAFGVRASTAWNWWNGDNRAAGDMVMRAVMAHPEIIEAARAEWRGAA